MVMSRDQHAVQNHSISIRIKSFERVEHLKYFGTSLMNQNSTHEEISSDCSQGMLAIIQCRIFCLPVGCPKI